MMVIDRLINQLGKPSGFFGKLIGLSMNFGHQKVYKMALGSINQDKKSRILDIGCGGGKFIQLLSKYYPSAEINGIDRRNCQAQDFVTMHRLDFLNMNQSSINTINQSSDRCNSLASIIE